MGWKKDSMMINWEFPIIVISILQCNTLPTNDWRESIYTSLILNIFLYLLYSATPLS